MQMAGSIVFELPTWWRGLRIAHKLSVGGSVLVACSMVHLGFMAAERVRDSAVHRSAAAAALYMDSFLAANVQELATQSSLSDENRMTLERLLSPSAMRRPVVAFRVWSGDMIAFSNERALIGQRFPHDRARDRALRGGIGVEFEDIGGDD